MTHHIGRSWSGSPLEDECPCPKAPCGLVLEDQTAPGCPQHAPERCKTMRQRHSEEECPGSQIVAPSQHQLQAVYDDEEW
jgi:hypothetical protein